MLRLRTFIAALVATIAAVGLVPPAAEAAQTRPCTFNANFSAFKALSTTSITTDFTVDYAFNTGCGASFSGRLTGTCAQFSGRGAMDGRPYTFSAVGPVLTLSGTVRGTIQLSQKNLMAPWCTPEKYIYDAVGELLVDY